MTLFDRAEPAATHVVHPTDLTLLSETAFAHALALTLACKGHLAVVHVGDPDGDQDSDWTAFPGVRAMLGKWGHLDKGSPRAAVAERLGIKVSKKLIPGSKPVEALEHFLEHEGCDLLVLATHAREGLARLLYGSIAEQLAYKADVPTLFLPPEDGGFIDVATGKAQLRNIVVPVDRQTPSHEAVSLALNIADVVGCPDALVHLLHVGPVDTAPTVAVAGHQEPRLRRLAAEGAVVPAIVDAARRLDAELIVMATHGHDDLLDSLRGSTTEQVLRQGGQGVLAVPAL